jgi:hypothetical protein
MVLESGGASVGVGSGAGHVGVGSEAGTVGAGEKVGEGSGVQVGWEGQGEGNLCAEGEGEGVGSAVREQAARRKVRVRGRMADQPVRRSLLGQGLSSFAEGMVVPL